MNMSFCGKCGAQINEDTKFCPVCGAAVNEAEAPAESAPAPDFNNQAQQGGYVPPVQNQAGADFSDKVKNLNNTADTTAEFEQTDIESNKVLAVLSYLGILVLVPIFAGKNSKFARYHANQGLVLAIAEVAYWIVQAILLAIINAIFPGPKYTLYGYTYSYGHSAIYNVFSFILGIVSIAFLVLAVIGIINAAQGKAKELPIIGKFKILK